MAVSPTTGHSTVGARYDRFTVKTGHPTIRDRCSSVNDRFGAMELELPTLQLRVRCREAAARLRAWPSVTPTKTPWRSGNLLGQPRFGQSGVVALTLAAAQVVGAQPLVAERLDRVGRQQPPELSERGAGGVSLTQVRRRSGDP
jgi:hypothetical protein